ncbi:Bacterial alpha-L-rhamnosidase [compost metagenome]
MEGEAKERATLKLMELLKESNYHLTTGFVGTPYLNFVLSDNGYNDIAYKLLFQQDYPSWLYQVTKGATTIWEHWDGIKEDGTFWSDDMNSFNHYAYGAIGDWLYRVVAGIDLDETVPAYKRIVIKPQPGEGLHWADGRLESMYGMIRSAWHKLDDGKLRLDVTVPVNTTAEILLPVASDESQVTESGKPLNQAEGIEKVETVEQGIRVTIGSGSYTFEFAQVK